MSWWPFVSRERYDEQRAEVERLRRELKQAVEAKEKLWNFLVWRVGGGVAVDVNSLPEQYQPKHQVFPSEPADEKKTEALKSVATPRSVRRDLASFEVRQEGEMLRKQGRIPPEKSSTERAVETITDLSKRAMTGSGKPPQEMAPGQAAVLAELVKTTNEAIAG